MGVEQALAPALNKVSTSFVSVMLEHGIPLEAIVTELVLSGEVERSDPAGSARGLRRANAAPLAREPVRPAVAQAEVFEYTST